MNNYHIHLVSDSTGETIETLAKACIAQFEGISVTENVWTLVRTSGQVSKILNAVKRHPGVVIFTMVDKGLRTQLEKGCESLGVPCIAVLDPIMSAFKDHFCAEASFKPGRQHEMDQNYFNRIEAMHFALAHDDGQSTHEIHKADIVLLGVSRTSKTPTSVYLANKGLKVANIPIVPQCPLPTNLTDPKFAGCLIIGLTKDPRRLVQVRKNRLSMLNETAMTDYVDLETVIEEVQFARKLCNRNSWPMVDVSRKSIEETATAILNLKMKRDQAYEDSNWDGE
ncbi:putative pyruvate, phosphate dikinase regulatory protein [Candidatus Terasakiella magnetica]|uniref:Putative pyruvate, phosphate dikinase regulatory protein n=1 Tax=Candidatus Terasakiella magnetica TaxID=1867952 RepID=A0A1C3RGB2_9PROT|nr:pyruvate, water dikinase regulatory protein [Candidatus Terasakiella magnetica]SCA56343.1 putative pyruvate, phosphate dikinase regulatory protein [Candidatus Terasakiella magnetica]